MCVCVWHMYVCIHTYVYICYVLLRLRHIHMYMERETLPCQAIIDAAREPPMSTRIRVYLLKSKSIRIPPCLPLRPLPRAPPHSLCCACMQSLHVLQDTLERVEPHSQDILESCRHQVKHSFDLCMLHALILPQSAQ